MQISIIAAVAKNGVIGKNNALPWRLPADLQYFKSKTLGHPIVMGRKNFESINRALPQRTNIVLTRNPNFNAEGCIKAKSLENAFEIARETGTDECFVIGGAEAYKEALPLCQKLYITIIHKEFEGDVYFPFIAELPFEQLPAASLRCAGARDIECSFRLISEVRNFPDDKNVYSYTFTIWEREFPQEQK